MIPVANWYKQAYSFWYLFLLVQQKQKDPLSQYDTPYSFRPHDEGMPQARPNYRRRRPVYYREGNEEGQFWKFTHPKVSHHSRGQPLRKLRAANFD